METMDNGREGSLDLATVARLNDVMQLLRQVLARGQAAVQVEDFHQVDDRPAPIELFLLPRSKSGQYGFYIDI
jgi:hypothetical protein